MRGGSLAPVNARDDKAEGRYLLAYERHQRHLDACDRFESAVMTVIVLAFVAFAWWVN